MDAVRMMPFCRPGVALMSAQKFPVGPLRGANRAANRSRREICHRRCRESPRGRCRVAGAMSQHTLKRARDAVDRRMPVDGKAAGIWERPNVKSSTPVA